MPISANGVPRRVLIAVGILVVGAIAVLGAEWLYFRLTHITTDAAYVKADMAEVAPEIAGRVLEVYVHDGEEVRKGQLLVKIEDEDWKKREQQAAAGVQQLTAQVLQSEAVLARTRESVPATKRAAEAGVVAAREQLAKARAALDYLQAQEKRLGALLQEKAVPKARWDEVHAGAEAARADVEAAKQGLNVAEAKLTEARAAQLQIVEAESALQVTRSGLTQAKAGYEQAQWTRGRAEVRSPIDGVAAKVFVHQGDFAAPGRPIAALYNPATRYVEARFEETRVAGLKVGQVAALRADASGDTVTGTVRRIVPAAAQEFALIPRDVTAGEFTKVVQRVAVELDISNVSSHPELVPGLSVEVSVRKS